MTEQHIFMGHDALVSLINRMARIIKTHLHDRAIDNPVLIGIHTGGAWVAQRLHSALQPSEPVGILDISFYRDDFTRIGVNPQVKPSDIPFDIEGRNVILVDDVIESGRTIRAAMNEIFDFGRPASITLVALIERSGRELPVQPDIIGLQPALNKDEHIRLNGPTPLSLEISGSKKPRE